MEIKTPDNTDHPNGACPIHLVDCHVDPLCGRGGVPLENIPSILVAALMPFSDMPFLERRYSRFLLSASDSHRGTFSAYFCCAPEPVTNGQLITPYLRLPMSSARSGLTQTHTLLERNRSHVQATEILDMGSSSSLSMASWNAVTPNFSKVPRHSLRPCMRWEFQGRT